MLTKKGTPKMTHARKGIWTLAAGLTLVSFGAAAEVPGNGLQLSGGSTGVALDAATVNAIVQKAVATSSVAARGTVTSGITMFGAFEPAARAAVIIAIRGPSLGTLGITQNFLDSPLACIFQGSTQLACANTCGGTTFQPVRDYYANVRGAPLSTRDSCLVGIFQPGAFTFTINPSSISSRTGEVLFEVLLDSAI